MNTEHTVTKMDQPDLEHAESENKLEQTWAELIELFENNELKIAETVNMDLSTDTKRSFVYKILKHYIKKNRYEKIIRFISDSVHRTLDIKEIIDNAVDTMQKHIEAAENVSFYMVEGNYAVLKSYRGYSDNNFITELSRIPSPKGFTWQTIRTGKPLYCPDVDNDPYIGLKGIKLGTKSYVSMPIHYMGKAIGCININSKKKYSFDKDELNLLEIVAGHIQTAINNAKQAEAISKSKEALKEAQNELEQRVRERTSELEKSNTLLI